MKATKKAMKSAMKKQPKNAMKAMKAMKTKPKASAKRCFTLSKDIYLIYSPKNGAKDDKSTRAELKQHQQFLKETLREYGKGLIAPLFDLVAGHSK